MSVGLRPHVAISALRFGSRKAVMWAAGEEGKEKIRVAFGVWAQTSGACVTELRFG